MSDEQRQAFEQKFGEAVSASLRRQTAPSELRARLLGRLQEEELNLTNRPNLSEESAVEFERSLSYAVERSQEWAPEDGVVFRTEAKLSAKLGKDLLSERALSFLLDSKEAASDLGDIEVDPDKVQFLQTLRSEVKRSTGELVAPESVRQAVLSSLGTTRPAPRVEERKVIPFRRPSQWKKALGAVTSLAAGFAIVVLTLFGSTDVALANSVRADHKTCCKSALQIQRDGPPSGMQAMLESKFGKVPAPSVDESWKLRVSKICQTKDGQPMVHLLYTRETDNEALQSLSFHFFPSQEGQRKKQYDVDEESAHILTNGEFPVLAWKEGDWVCTACSPDLDAESLRAQVKGV